MISDRNVLPERRVVPLGGLLAALCGFGLLLAFAKFDDFGGNMAAPARTALMVVAALLLVWGSGRLFFGLNRSAANWLQTPWYVGAGESSRRHLLDVLRVALAWIWAPAAPRRRSSSVGRHRVAIPQEGLVYLAILAVAFLGSLMTGSNMLMLVFAMLAGPFIVNGWVTFTMLKGLNVDRSLPPRTMAGEPFLVELSLENQKRLLSSWVMGVRDRVESPWERLEAEVVFPRLPPRSRRAGRYWVRLMRRGRYRFGRLTVVSRFPLGIVERGREFDRPGEILVHPRLGRLTDAWDQQRLAQGELARRQRPRPGVFDDEFHHLREYRPGDGSRSIHWRTSARRGELMVQEHYPSRQRDLTVIADLYQPPRPQQDDLEAVEMAVSFIATVCVEHLRKNRDSQLKLAINGVRETHWDGTGGPLGVESLLDLLAVVEAGPSNDFGGLVERVTAGTPRMARTVIVTTRQDGGESDDRTPSLPWGNGRTTDAEIVRIPSARLSRVFHLV